MNPFTAQLKRNNNITDKNLTIKIRWFDDMGHRVSFKREGVLLVVEGSNWNGLQELTGGII